jgi:hypothetical protein
MRQLVYALRFTGRATPASPDGSVLTVAATAPGPLPAAFGPDEAAGALAALPAGQAVLKAEVTLTGATSFQAVGEIAFGGGTTLRVAAVGGGYLGPGPDRADRHGAVAWRVEGGEGRFAGARGLITSNLVVGEDLAVTDYQLGVLSVPLGVASRRRGSTQGRSPATTPTA